MHSDLNNFISALFIQITNDLKNLSAANERLREILTQIENDKSINLPELMRRLDQLELTEILEREQDIILQVLLNNNHTMGQNAAQWVTRHYDNDDIAAIIAIVDTLRPTQIGTLLLAKNDKWENFLVSTLRYAPKRFELWSRIFLRLVPAHIEQLLKSVSMDQIIVCLEIHDSAQIETIFNLLHKLNIAQIEDLVTKVHGDRLPWIYHLIQYNGDKDYIEKLIKLIPADRFAKILGTIPPLGNRSALIESISAFNTQPANSILDTLFLIAEEDKFKLLQQTDCRGFSVLMLSLKCGKLTSKVLDLIFSLENKESIRSLFLHKSNRNRTILDFCQNKPEIKDRVLSFILAPRPLAPQPCPYKSVSRIRLR